MTNTSKVAKVRQRKPKGPFSDELLDQILSQLKGHDAESLLGQSGLVAQLKKQLAERMLSPVLSRYLPVANIRLPEARRVACEQTSVNFVDAAAAAIQ